jgi:hypothetical protein
MYNHTPINDLFLKVFALVQKSQRPFDAIALNRLGQENKGIKKAPVKVEGNLMFSQRNNPYCDLLSSAMI